MATASLAMLPSDLRFPQSHLPGESPPTLTFEIRKQRRMRAEGRARGDFGKGGANLTTELNESP
jgi:hypothetical protein